MANTKLIAMILIGLMVVKTEGNLMWYASCCATVGVTSVFAGPAVLATLGFTSTGIIAGSWAAGWMASYGGSVTAGGLFATLQGIGASGAMKWTGIPYINAVCTYLCYD